MALTIGVRYPARFAGYTAAGDPLFNVFRGGIAEVLFAQLTARSGTQYSWREMDSLTTGGWTPTAGGLSGTLNAYEANGVTIEVGAIVELWEAPNLTPVEYRFQACCPKATTGLPGGGGLAALPTRWELDEVTLLLMGKN